MEHGHILMQEYSIADKEEWRDVFGYLEPKVEMIPRLTLYWHILELLKVKIYQAAHLVQILDFFVNNTVDLEAFYTSTLHCPTYRPGRPLMVWITLSTRWIRPQNPSQGHLSGSWLADCS
jgi:hypothetical protein